MKTISHEENGFVELGEFLKELQELTGCAPVVVLEATGHYHRALVAYMERSGWKHFIEIHCNPNEPKELNYAKSKQTPQMRGI